MEVVDERKKSLWQRINDSAVIKRVKSIKNFQIIVVIFIIAIALIIYSTVITSKEQKGSETTNSTVVMNSEEQRLCGALSSIEGVGDVKTMITKNGNDVVGVIVIADGASNPLVRIKIVEAVSVALGIEPKLVSVFTGQR